MRRGVFRRRSFLEVELKSPFSTEYNYSIKKSDCKQFFRKFFLNSHKKHNLFFRFTNFAALAPRFTLSVSRFSPSNGIFCTCDGIFCITDLFRSTAVHDIFRSAAPYNIYYVYKKSAPSPLKGKDTPFY